MRRLTLLPLVPLLGLAACGSDEGLVIEDMTGTIVVPREAATREMPNGETITDVRLIGPVYLGFYPAVSDEIFSYPHPEIGPSFNDDTPGNTYPYGGTSVGDIRYPCLQSLVCRVTSGRFLDYDGILDWFNTYYEETIVDGQGREVRSGEFIRQTCFERLRVTADEEVRIVAHEDRNDDGLITLEDLEFVENADGDFEAEFIFHQQEFFQGFQLWGWMDSPALVDGRLNSCDPSQGFQDGEYTNSFRGGRPFRDLLNFPSTYIQEGDWVVSEPHVYTSVDDTVVIRIDEEVTE